MDAQRIDGTDMRIQDGTDMRIKDGTDIRIKDGTDMSCFLGKCKNIYLYFIYFMRISSNLNCWERKCYQPTQRQKTVKKPPKLTTNRQT